MRQWIGDLPAASRADFGWQLPAEQLPTAPPPAPQIDFSADNKTVTFGAGSCTVVPASWMGAHALCLMPPSTAAAAGVNSAVLQAALHDSGISGGALPAGVCAFVGTSGWKTAADELCQVMFGFRVPSCCSQMAALHPPRPPVRCR